MTKLASVSRGGILGVIEVDHRRSPLKMPQEIGRDMIAQRAFLDDRARTHPFEAVAQREPGAGDRRRARAAVGLDDVAVDDDLALAQRRQIGHGAQRAADQALDFLRAAGGLAGGGLAARARVRGARQHGVFRRHPAAALAAQPRRRLVLERRRAQHMRIAEFHETGALRVTGDAALETDRAHFVGRAFAGTHKGSLSYWFAPSIALCAAERKAAAARHAPCVLRSRPHGGTIELTEPTIETQAPTIRREHGPIGVGEQGAHSTGESQGAPADRAGGPFSKRQDHTIRGSILAHAGAIPRQGAVARGRERRRRQPGGARPSDERRVQYRDTSIIWATTTLSSICQAPWNSPMKRAMCCRGRRRDRRLRGRSAQDSGAAARVARARGVRRPAFPVPEQDRRGDHRRARNAHHVAAGVAHALAAAADSDLEQRRRRRLHRSRAGARLCLSRACAVRGRRNSLGRRRDRRRKRATRCWSGSPITTTR